MKKYLDVISLGCSVLLNALLFAFMALPGLIGVAGEKYSVYSCLSGDTFYSDGVCGGLLVALILLILALCAGLFLCALIFLNKKLGFTMLIALGAGLFLLIAGILFFCTSSFIGYGSLGVGSVLSGIFAILAGLGYVFYGAIKGKLIKL